MLTSYRKHPESKAIDAARHHAFLKEVLPHLIGGMFTATFVYFIFRDFSNAQQELIWLIGNSFLMLITLFVYAVYYKKHDLFSLQQWSYIPVVVAACWGVCWALTPFLFLNDADIVYASVLTTVLLALSIAPAPVMVYYPSAYVIFISLPIVSLNVFIVTHGIITSPLITALLIFTLFSLLAYGWNLHGTMIKMLTLDIEKTAALKIAEQSNIAKSKFLAAASHDIRQPLQALNLFLQALSDRNQHAEDRMLFDRMEASANSMSELLNSLLDVSRLDARVINVSPEHLSVKALCEKTMRELEQQNTNNAIAIKVHCDNVTAFVDPILLERVINNLLSNALRYTHAGEIILTVEKDKEHIIFSVSDTGIGISQQNQEAIFTEFYQVSNPERDQKKGLGLGLSIVKRLCELQDWPLNFVSEEGVGSVFSFSVDQGDALQIKKDITLSPSMNLQAVSVVVIDDEESIREGLYSLLSHWGCLVHTYSCQQNALDALASKTCPTPNLIISDYRLRENENGINVINTLRNYLGNETKAILITGDTGVEQMKDARDSGLMVLHKPIKPALLRKSIQMLMKDFL